MARRILMTAALLWAGALASGAAANKITKETLRIDRDTRPYYRCGSPRSRDTINYYRRADAINRQAWDFLKSHALAAEPHFEVYATPARR